MYNVERYLVKCLDSILQQDFNDYEVLLIDDGSPDNSGIIADDYDRKYTNIKSYHKINGGLSDARNYGLSHATGTYVLFVDSDDYLAEGSLSSLAKALVNNQPDILYFNSVWIKESTSFICRKNGLKNGIIYSGVESLKTELETGKYMAAVWGGVYKRDFLVKNELLFKKGIYHEDEEWMPRVQLCASKVEYIPNEVYCYVIREGSITTHGDNPKNGYDILDTTKNLYEEYLEIKNAELKKSALRYNAKLYMKGFSILIRCGKKIKPDKKIIYGFWTTFRLFIQATLLCLTPRFYAEYFDAKILSK